MTTGPLRFSGPIGKDLPGRENLLVTEFELINCVIPKSDKKILCKDQLYLLNVSNLIQSEHCSEDFQYVTLAPFHIQDGSLPLTEFCTYT